MSPVELLPPLNGVAVAVECHIEYVIYVQLVQDIDEGSGESLITQPLHTFRIVGIVCGNEVSILVGSDTARVMATVSQ